MALQDAHLQERADAASDEIARLKLDGPKLSKVGLELKTVLARFERPHTLAFNLTQEARTRDPISSFSRIVRFQQHKQRRRALVR